MRASIVQDDATIVARLCCLYEFSGGWVRNSSNRGLFEERYVYIYIYVYIYVCVFIVLFFGDRQNIVVGG